ncbi:SulP family inorganic anion transporter [Nibricoccus sp. IMCC34717]|uniref:SulP family inorganic anion transporter n=1 Tax=Nibricoccus sp. IMCC34717 TaxID=3034021 RepID=UPI003851550C
MSSNDGAAETVDQIQRFSKRWLKERLPLLDTIRGYDAATFKADAIAGATVSLVSIPQAIGFALIVGLPPLMVIMSVIVGGFFCALFSSSRHLVFGPTNSISIILTATIYRLGQGSGLGAAEIALILGVLIGLFQLVAGIAQLGKVTQFISRSVIIAYSSAVGLLLAAGQLPHLLGMEAGARGSFVDGLIGAAYNLAHLKFNLYAAALGLATLLIFEAIERFLPRWPAELFGLVFLSLLTKYAGLKELGIRVVGDEGALAVSIPSFGGIPAGALDWGIASQLIGAALAISLLGMLEAISIAKTLAARSGQRIDSNQELIAMGVGNLANSFYGAMPGSASFARSASNLQSGGRTQVSSLLSSVMVLGALFFVAPVINFMPIPSLAAHLIRIGLRLINREQIRIAMRSTGSDVIVFVSTLAAAFLLKLDIAIYVGVGVSLALFLRKASAPSLVEYSFSDSGTLTELEDKSQRRNQAISIVHVEGELFFGAADLFQEQVRILADEGDIRVVILRMKNARHLDATSVMSLLHLHEYLRKTGRHLLVSGINPDVERVLRKSGALVKVGAENIFPAEANLTASTRKALLRASHLLQTGKADVRIFYDRKRDKGIDRKFPDDHGKLEDYAI